MSGTAIEYDSTGRMKYHPDYHPKRGQPFNDDELCYLAKFYTFDGKASISLALDRPESSVQKRYIQLAKSGLLEHYRKLEFYI
ncbi:DNA-entry nuclease [Paenibacillus dendritiformis]|uniref:DNA-entry nuclease n=1 Tax=Paenibacillus dendritiformis TaxID=130049 RepID=UPI000DA82F78|nr:DNA-entry nuclease [Paenibacillus dendritiformis]PZM62590.1 DNA-entry nuclease [Paenibacillus dendritiformis]